MGASADIGTIGGEPLDFSSRVKAERSARPDIGPQAEHCFMASAWSSRQWRGITIVATQLEQRWAGVRPIWHKHDVA